MQAFLPEEAYVIEQYIFIILYVYVNIYNIAYAVYITDSHEVQQNYRGGR